MLSITVTLEVDEIFTVELNLMALANMPDDGYDDGGRNGPKNPFSSKHRPLARLYLKAVYAFGEADIYPKHSLTVLETKL